MLSRLVTRRLRFFHPHLLRERAGLAVSDQSFGYHGSDFSHARYATDWRILVRFDRRPFWPPSRADDRHYCVFGLRAGLSLRSFVEILSDHAGILWHCDGRRMGSRRSLGIRIVACGRTRILLRPVAGGLRRWLSDGRSAVWHVVPVRRMAGHVRDWSAARIPGHLH